VLQDGTPLDCELVCDMERARTGMRRAMFKRHRGVGDLSTMNAVGHGLTMGAVRATPGKGCLWPTDAREASAPASDTSPTLRPTAMRSIPGRWRWRAGLGARPVTDFSGAEPGA
jgi:hypothetical protein